MVQLVIESSRHHTPGIMLRSFGNLPGTSDTISKFFLYSNDLLNMQIWFTLMQFHSQGYNLSPTLSWHLSDAQAFV